MKVGYVLEPLGTVSAGSGADEAALCADGCQEIYRDASASTRDHRPGLVAALDALTTGDVFVLARLETLDWTAREAVRTLGSLSARGVGIRILDPLVDTEAGVQRQTAELLVRLAAMDGEHTRRRSRMGREAMRARGRRGGRKPQITDEQRRQVLSAIAAGEPVALASRRAGLSRASGYRILQAARLEG